MSRVRITRSNLSNLTDDQIELLVNQPEEDAIEFEIDQSDIENYSDNEDQTQLQPEDIDIEEQLENNDESENDTIDRLEVTARVRRKFTNLRNLRKFKMKICTTMYLSLKLKNKHKEC